MDTERNNKSVDDISLSVAWESLRQEIKNDAPGRAAQFYQNVRDIEYDFAKRNERLADNNGMMSESEFLKWEDAIADELKWAKEEEKRGAMNFGQVAEARQNFVAYLVDKELHKTIEARAANFFYERYQTLKEAINNAGGDKAKDHLKYVNSFYQTVDGHLAFKYMTPDEVQDYGPDMYERQRTYSHNEVIRHLNGMNDLANGYGVRPFTVRNFWTSDLVSKDKQTTAMERIMRYDRDIVEEYYAIAFGSDVRKYQAKLEHFNRLGLT